MSGSRVHIDLDDNTVRIITQEESDGEGQSCYSIQPRELPYSSNDNSTSYDPESSAFSDVHRKRLDRRSIGPRSLVQGSDYEYIDPASAKTDGSAVTTKHGLSRNSKRSGRVPESDPLSLLDRMADTLDGITVVSIDSRTGESFLHGSDESTRSVQADVSQLGLDIVEKPFLRCQFATSADILAWLKIDYFEVGEARHGTFDWLVVPSRIKLQAFEELKKITEDKIKTELQSKMDYAIFVLTEGLELWLGAKADGCCCRENIYMMDGSVPRLSNDDDSLIRCRVRAILTAVHYA